MNSPRWRHLLIDVQGQFPAESALNAVLTTEQTEKLKAVENAAENFSLTIGHGLAALGELIVHAATHGDLTEELAVSTGWLVNSLALLNMSMAESGAAAAYKLANIPPEGCAMSAPQKGEVAQCGATREGGR
jgi:hypothetical protein